MLGLENNNEERTIENVINDFINYCEVKNLSEQTIKYYQNQFKIFSRFYDSENIIDDLRKEHINSYILHLKKDLDITETTVNTYLRALRAFLYYAMENGELEKFKIEMIKTEEKIKETYSDQELRKLWDKPDLDECTFAHYRNWVTINFLLGTGCRSKSLLNVKIKDLRFDEGCVLFRKSKNRKQQLIPLSRKLDSVLKEYLRYRKGEDKDYLFCTERGQKLTRSGLRSAIKRYNNSKGLSKTSIHLFRHTFAKKWILNNGDPYRLQKILGHSSMEIVRRYVNMFSEDLKKNFNSFNPLEEFNNSGEHIKI